MKDLKQKTGFTLMSKARKGGFTLVELLVVMAILAILSTVGFGQYRTSQKKARDAQRKADLSHIARALEMYYSDHKSYPLGEGGKIGTLNWGDSFEDENSIYMKKLPEDPADNREYCYQSDDGSYFEIFATLENERDLDYQKDCCSGDSCQCYICNGEKLYRYELASSNREKAPCDKVCSD